MLTKEELHLLNNLNYTLTKRKDINRYVQVRVYKTNITKDTIISIYNSNTHTSVLLYSSTYSKLLDNNVLIDSSEHNVTPKIKNKKVLNKK